MNCLELKNSLNIKPIHSVGSDCNQYRRLVGNLKLKSVQHDNTSFIEILRREIEKKSQ